LACTESCSTGADTAQNQEIVPPFWASQSWANSSKAWIRL